MKLYPLNAATLAFQTSNFTDNGSSFKTAAIGLDGITQAAINAVRKGGLPRVDSIEHNFDPSILGATEAAFYKP